MNKKFAFLPALASLLALALPSASAVPVTFSGGPGTPLSMTLQLPVTYTITADYVGSGGFIVTKGGSPVAVNFPILFVFEDTGNFFGGSGSAGATSDINFTINAGPPHLLGLLLPRLRASW
jgi:hypothetical protein